MRIFSFRRLLPFLVLLLLVDRVCAQNPANPRNPANLIVEGTDNPPSPKSSSIHFHAGIGFNAISVMGPSVHLGASYSNFQLEAAYVFGLGKVENIVITLPNATSQSEAYDYSCSKVWVRLGYSFGLKAFHVSPQVGVSFNMISGKEVSGVSNSSNNFKDSNPMGVFGAIRLSYEVIDHLHIHLTPQYDFNIGGDQIFEVIKKGDSKLKSWGEGFGINAGVIYEF